MEHGVISETALYTCLRLSNDPRFVLPKYPQIFLKKHYDQSVTYKNVLEEFFESAGRALTMDEVAAFSKKLFMKQYSLFQNLDAMPDVLKCEGGFIHCNNLNIQADLLTGIYQLIDRYLAGNDHVSVKKIFAEKKVTCKLMKIDDSLMLYSVLRKHNDNLLLDRYPLIRFASDEEKVKKRTISQLIVKYVKEKETYCTAKEIEAHFVEKLGYDKSNTYVALNSLPQIITYSKGCFVHIDALGWTEEKQAQFEAVCNRIYQKARKAGTLYGLIENVVEATDLPSLGNQMYWTESIAAELITKQNRFLLIGNKRNAFVPYKNKDHICCLEDLLYAILKANYMGATNIAV